jgi:hypothetical protein
MTPTAFAFTVAVSLSGIESALWGLCAIHSLALAAYLLSFLRRRS